MAGMRICLIALLALVAAATESVSNVDVSNRAHGGDAGSAAATVHHHPHKRQRQHQNQHKRDLLSSKVEYDKDGQIHQGETTGLNQSTPLRAFEPAAPILGPNYGILRLAHPYQAPSHGADHDEILLVQHNFRSSKPFVVDYTPPSANFNRVVLNLSVSTEGFQRDRVGSLYLGDSEVWRMSTVSARPEQGLEWGFLKDMTAYLALWRQPQRIVLDLPNSVDDTYTGSFNVTITATYVYAFLTKDKTPHAPADVILPIGAGRGSDGGGSAWKYPKEQTSKMTQIPRNVNRAHVGIHAMGLGREEFWWSNVPDSRADFFVNSSGPLPAGTGVREIRLSVDGFPAGIAWPFPALLAGGIAAPMNRPAAPPQAFDLRESEIDISVWLPYLCDGRPHNFSLDVFQFHDELGNNEELQSVRVETNYWLLSANLFLWLDEDEAAITTGSLPMVEKDEIRWKIDGNMTADTNYQNHGMTYDMRLYRLLRLKTRRVTTENGTDERMWQQQFEASSLGYFDREMRRGIDTMYEGKSDSYTDRAAFFHTAFEYPLTALISYLLPESRDGSFTIRTQLKQTVITTLVGKTAFVAGFEPWVKLDWKVNKDPPRGTCMHFVRHGETLQMQNANGTMMLGRGDVEVSFRFGITPYHVDAQRPGCFPEPLLYRRDVLMNMTRYRDRIWTSKLDEPFHYEVLGMSHLISSLEEQDMKNALHDKPPYIKFAPIDMDDGAWKVFMGVPLDAL